ncbi:MAG: hypothetical protein J5985_00765, partial [Kiritimatiellae bacterium]|nr:hypothetical protein [Kiritimatiellia bacterium]
MPRGNGRNPQRHNGRQKNHRPAGLPADLGAGENAPDPVSMRMPTDTVVDVMAMAQELAPNAPLPVIPEAETPAEPPQAAAEPVQDTPAAEQPEAKPAEPAPAPKRRGRKPKAKPAPVDATQPADGAQPPVSKPEEAVAPQKTADAQPAPTQPDSPHAAPAQPAPSQPVGAA